MFKVDNEDTRMTSQTLSIFHTSFNIFIVDFEQVNVRWG